MNNVVEISGGKEKNYQVIRVTLETCKMGEEMGVDDTIGLKMRIQCQVLGTGKGAACGQSGSSRSGLHGTPHNTSTQEAATTCLMPTCTNQNAAELEQHFAEGCYKLSRGVLCFKFAEGCDIQKQMMINLETGYE